MSAAESDALRFQGNEKLEAGETKEALALYKQAAEAALPAANESSAATTALAAALKNAAAAQLRLGLYADAEKSATEAIHLEGESVVALYRRALARRLLYDYEEAYEDLVRALALEPHSAVLREELIKLQRAALSGSDESSMAERLDKLVKAYTLEFDDDEPVDSTSAADIATACTEPFYLAHVRGMLDVQALENEVKQVQDVLYFGPSEVVSSPAATLPREQGDNRTPYVLDVRVPGAGNFYTAPLVFRLAFGHRYPLAPPKVRCVSLAQHAAFVGPQGSHDAHHARRATLDFYEALLAARSGTVFSVTSTLQCISYALEAPLGRGWAQFARKHKERQIIIDKFIGEHQHAVPELFSAPADLSRIISQAIAPELRHALAAGNVTSVCDAVSDGVWSFPLFSTQFAGQLLAEIDCFYATGLPANRPNSMNNYGVIVNDIGLEPFITTLQQTVLQPIASELFKENAGPMKGHPGAKFDSHHSFIVKYRADEDSHLDAHPSVAEYSAHPRRVTLPSQVHTDDSDVTFNTCLGRDFDGCGLVFCGMIGTKGHRQHCLTYYHSIGRCVVHLGNRRHGADHITRGERLNLIVWNHGLGWRESPSATSHNRDYEQEDRPPDPRCLSYTHDRDYARFKEYPKDRTRFKGRGWCPPHGAEYPGFVPEQATT